MTKEEFLKQLKNETEKNDVKWVLQDTYLYSGAMRTAGETQLCPLEFVGGGTAIFDNCNRLNLPLEIGVSIAGAADNINVVDYSEVRNQLLEAVGLLKK